MNSKISLNELTDLLSESAKISKREANAFLKALFDAIETHLITDKLVKIKGLGTFKLIWVENRRIANVNTGEIQEIPGHYKTTFTPDADLAEAVNEPFSHFDTIVLDDEIIADKPIDPVDEYLNELKNRPDLQMESEAFPTENDEDEPTEEAGEALDMPQTDETEPAEPTEETSWYQLSQAEEVSMPEEEESEQPAPSMEESPEPEEVEEQTEKPEEATIPHTHLPYTPSYFATEETEEKAETEEPEQPIGITPREEEKEEEAGSDSPLEKSTSEEKDDDEEEEEDDDETEKSGSSFRWIIWLVVAGMAGIGGFFGYTYLYGLFPFEKTNEQESSVIIAPQPTTEPTTATVAIPDTTNGDTTQATANQASEPKRKTIAETIEERQKAIKEGYQPEKQSKTILATEKMVVGSRLTKLALKYYGSRIFWVYIYEANKDKIEDPNNVPEGTVVDIPDKSVYQIDKENPESVKRANKLAESILKVKP